MRITLLSAAFLATGIASAATPVDGWYTGLFGGYTYIPDYVTNNDHGLYMHQATFNNGYNAGGRAGYQSNPIRYEIEYTYLHADLNHYKIEGIHQKDISGFSSDNMIMANIYYDTPEMLPAIVPYLGAGIGYANVKTNININPYNANSYYFETNDGAFAYQGTVGITYNFAENYAANLGYRFVATSHINNLGTSFEAHIANAGVVYRFDRGNYK